MMVSLDDRVLDFVEEHGTEWVVRVDGRWSRWGLAYGVSPRWYFVTPGSTWYHITEYETDEKTRRTGTSRWSLESSVDDTVETGELVHLSHAPPEVQLWAAGFRPDFEELDERRDHGSKQETLSGWA